MADLLDQAPPSDSPAPKHWQRNSVERVLNALVSSRTGEAIALQGPWGVGKTYFWNNSIVPKLLDKPWKKRYSYVSLFGVNSLQELKVALAVATEEFDRDARKKHRLGWPVIGWFWRGWGWLSDALKVVPKVGAGLSNLIDRIGFYMVRDRVICFDDVERRGKSLDLKDFFGLVSYLAELRECRVLVILNSDRLGVDSEDQRTWEDVREKVFQGEVNFNPSADQAVELALEADVAERWQVALGAAFTQLGVSNIRLVRRGAKFMRLLMEEMEGRVPRSDTVDRMAYVVALLVYSIHGRGVGGPPFDRIQNQTRIGVMAAMNAEDTRSQKERDWDRAISNYNVYLHTALDSVLVDMVRNGYPNGDAFRSAIDEAEVSNEVFEHMQAWGRAWRLYHDTVSDNENAIIAEFERTWPPVSAYENQVNLQSAVRILRKLGRPDLATRFIQQWVGERAGDRIKLLDDRELHSFDRITDEEILAEVNAARMKTKAIMPPMQAFEVLMERGAYPEDAIASLAETSVADLLSVVEEIDSKDLSSTIKKIVDLHPRHDNPNWEIASAKMVEVCKQIAARSPLGASRMKSWLGWDPPPAHEDGEG